MSLEPVLRTLATEGLLEVSSTPELANQVHRRAKALAKERDTYYYRKRPTPVTVDFNMGLRVRPVDVLHELGVATTFFVRSPFADVARLWAQARYCGTLGTSSRKLILAADADDVVYHHKVTQSEQLGIGFALIVAKAILRKWYPRFDFQVVDAEAALKAGFVDAVGPVYQRGKTKMRPDYLLIGHHIAGGAAKVVVLECKGTHQDKRFAVEQLATASVQVETVEVGSTTPRALMVASCLAQSGITAYVLDPPGDDDLWSGTHMELNELLSESPEDIRLPLRRPSADEIGAKRRSLESDELTLFDETQVVQADFSPGAPDVCRIPDNRREWFFQILAHSAAASTLLYAGDIDEAAAYATAQQRGLIRRHSAVDQPTLIDAEEIFIEEVGTAWSSFRLANEFAFEGTRYTMPLPGRKVLEVRRGVEIQVYRELRERRLWGYWQSARRAWRRWRNSALSRSGNGVISLSPDGTVMTVNVIDASRVD